MSSDQRHADGSESTATGGSERVRTRDELRAELELLRERTERLQASYLRARQNRYRRTAAGFAVLGVLALVGAVLFPDVREVLLVLGGTGLFGAVITWYLTPERFVSATVGTAVYDAVAADRSALVDELGLTDHRVYVPLGAGAGRVRLFVPQFDAYGIPAADDLDAIHVVPSDSSNRGVAFRPTGGPLLDELEADALGDTPSGLATQLTDAIVEQFELAKRTRVDLDSERGRLTVGVSDGVYGALTRIDHPIPSVLAVGLAAGLQQPVTVETRRAEDDRFAYQVTCRWPTDS